MYGFIYITSNLINGKRYIGQKRYASRGVEEYLGTGRRMIAAIRKYGKENFSRVIIDECETREELNEAERFWIKTYDAAGNPMFYNITPGGEGGSLFGRKHREDTRALMSERAKQRTRSKSHCERLGVVQRKSFKIRDPHGVIHEGVGLKQFCLAHGLNQGAMNQVTLGKWRHHKGWTNA